MKSPKNPLRHEGETLLLSAPVSSESYTHVTLGRLIETRELVVRHVNVHTGVFSAGLYSHDLVDALVHFGTPQEIENHVH